MRILTENLNRLVTQINKATYSPTEPWTKKPNKIIVSNEGCFHIESGYGRVTLSRMTSNHGTTSNVFQVGYIPKSDLYNRMQAFLAGILVGKECMRT